MKSTPKPKEPEFKLKRCPYCKLLFRPMLGRKNVRANAERQRFCSTKCRAGFHRNGGMNFEVMMERIERKVLKIVDARWAEIAESVKTELLQILETRRPQLGPIVEPSQTVRELQKLQDASLLE
jgi:Ser/Thr protein kinase RdoA (MazF antagonist)